VITLDDLEDSYPDDGDHCCYCGRKWDSHSPWEFFYLDNHLLCEGCAPEYRRARSRREPPRANEGMITFLVLIISTLIILNGWKQSIKLGLKSTPLA
jgi:hypothetical protein